jgi:hypothetical protein
MAIIGNIPYFQTNPYHHSAYLILPFCLQVIRPHPSHQVTEGGGLLSALGNPPTELPYPNRVEISGKNQEELITNLQTNPHLEKTVHRNIAVKLYICLFTVKYTTFHHHIFVAGMFTIHGRPGGRTRHPHQHLPKKIYRMDISCKNLQRL